VKLLRKKTWRIVFLFAAAALALLWLNRSTPASTDSPQNISGHGEIGQASDVASYPSASDLEMFILDDTGYLGILYEDNQSGEEHDITVYFTNDEGEMMVVESDTPMEYLDYNGDYVSVDYIANLEIASDGTRELHIAISDIETLQNDPQNAVTGNTRWVNIACRFSDIEATPQPIEYFQAIMVNQEPGMDNYWRTTSDDLVNIEGSGAFGWYNLPETKQHYLNAANANTGFALRKLLTDCAQLAAQTDGVDFSQFGGINVMLNDTFGCCAWGGRMPLNVNGSLVQFRTTWLPPWAFNSLHVIAHEMGHGWGLPHSSGPYGKVYDSAWDVMSGGNSNHTDAICRVTSDPLGCWQVGTIALHLGMLGWIPEGRAVTVNSGDTVEVTLDALTTYGSTNGTMVALIPISGGSTFYTVEVRSFVAYDRNLPGEAIVIHQVTPTRDSPAHVVDGDNNGNPNDEGAMWRVGETFTDSRAGITVEVVSNLGTTFTVRISNK
jgi:hypothetical protein